MGSDFSLPTPHHSELDHAHLTRRNTIANRSPTPVAKHIALARLADRLARLGDTKRQQFIHQMHIPGDVLRQASRYAPPNSFAATQQPDESDDRFGVDSERESQETEVDSDVESPQTPPPPKRKFVSFAKYAELRFFRE